MSTVEAWFQRAVYGSDNWSQIDESGFLKPVVGSVSLQGYQTASSFVVNTLVGSLGISGNTGSASQQFGVSVPSGQWFPRYTNGFNTWNQGVSFSGQLFLVGYAPISIKTVNDLGWDEFISLKSTFSGSGSKVAIYDPRRAYPSVGSISVIGDSPSIGISVLTKVGNLSIGKYAPVVSIELSQTGALSLSGNAPTLERVNPTQETALALTGYALTLGIKISVKASSLTISGNDAAIADYFVPVSGNLSLTGHSPSLQKSIVQTSGILRSRRAFIEFYTDLPFNAEFSADRASFVSDVIRNSVGYGNLISEEATIYYKGWSPINTSPESWNQQTTSYEYWAEQQTSGEWSQQTTGNETWTPVTTTSENWDV